MIPAILLAACTPEEEAKESADTSVETGETSAEETDTGDSDTGDSETGDSETGDSETGDSETGDSDTAPVTGSFTLDVYPVHTASCVSCHPWGNAPRSTYDRLMEMAEEEWRFFVPGSPAESLWYLKLTEHPPLGARMPYALRYLDSSEIDALRAWIEGGASRDGFNAGFFQAWERSYCFDCHSAWGGHDEAAVYTQLMSLTFHAGRMVEPGDADASVLYQKTALKTAPYGERMPVLRPYLEADAIARIEAWVADGCVYDGE